MIVYLRRSGPPEAMNCPVVMCDACQTPIQGKVGGDGYGGIVIWSDNDDGSQDMATVHKGRCNRAYEAANRRSWLWEDLDTFLGFLTHNTAEPFPAERNVEYVAPAPSRWRQGRYERQGQDDDDR